MSLSLKKKKYEVTVLSVKENFVFLHLIYKSNMRRLNKIASKITEERKKNLQINILFIKEYKNTCHYSRYVKQKSLKKIIHFFLL